MGKWKSLTRKLWGSITIFTAFVLMLILCANILTKILWDNSNKMGLSLVKNFTSAQEQNIKTCEALLGICMDHVTQQEQTDASAEEILEGLYPFIHGLTGLYGEDQIQVYGKVQGSFLASDRPELQALGDIEVTDRPWYQGAAAAGGGTYISPLYQDAATGLSVVTMCRLSPETGSFLAIDMKPSCFEAGGRNIALPEQASYFLADQDGFLLYYLSSWNYGREELQEVVFGYRKNAVYDVTNHVSENVRGPDGIVRNVYFHHMDNGWTGILTLPRDKILSGSHLFRGISYLLVFFGIVLILFQSLREYKNIRREEEYRIYQNAMNSTARACRAIYYINVKTKIIDTVYPLGPGGEPRRSTYDSEVMDRFKYGVVAEEHVGLVTDFLDMSNIIERLSQRDHIELQFKRSMFDVNKRETKAEGYEWCSISVTVAEKTADGKLSAIAMAIRNIDDVIRREEQQRQVLSLAVARAEAASRAKSDFLSRMSHDIRTPMNAILGMTSIAIMHIDEKSRVLDALGKITVSGKHLLGLINDVLDMSRIESGKLSLTEGSFSLSDITDGLLAIFRSPAEAKQLSLDVHIVELEHENVIGDEQHLQQIFMNIMGNAVKFTPAGGSITIYIEEKPSHIAGRGCYEFTFADTGIGMEQKYIETIFEPFSRAANSSGNKIEGTGLGMSIAVNIARMMDGDIKVESTLGKGSRFTVMVYLKLDQAAPAEGEALSPLPVLVVDDEETACETACEMLRSIGMEAEYVLDGDSAIRRVMEAGKTHTPFSVIILDWMMPGKDGLTTAKELRKLTGGQIPIIILSAYDWSDIEAEAKEAGVDAFISKPMFKSKLVRALQSVLCQDGEEAGAGVLETFKEQDFSGRRVLLVEDNEINIEVAQELLNIVGIQVETALNGRLAVEHVLEAEPGYFDLIFMDIQMPVMNGYEAAKAIRSSGREDLRTIPIVAMTADAFSDDIMRAKAAGMDDHVSKPVDIERLEAILQKWVGAKPGQ